jgi:hypothetical protein
MALETAFFISGLNSANPQSTDSVAQADDHLRLIKSTVKNTFPNLTGAVTKTHSQINDLLEKSGGTMTGLLTLSGAPSSNLHAATKAYVDTADATKANTSTTISAGDGLTGGGSLSTNRTLSIADSGVTTVKIADDAVTADKIADDAVTADKIADGDVVLPGDFTGDNQSLSASGYQKLPGGLILQWGTVASTSDAAQIFTFPIAFPTACFIAVGSFVTESSYPVRISATSTTTFTVDRADAVSDNDIRYFAIGY